MSECPLTPRQIDMVVHLADGISAKEIARKLDLSPWHVHSCIKDAMKIAGTGKATGLVAMALRRGWIQ